MLKKYLFHIPSSFPPASGSQIQSSRDKLKEVKSGKCVFCIGFLEKKMRPHLPQKSPLLWPQPSGPSGSLRKAGAVSGSHALDAIPDLEKSVGHHGSNSQKEQSLRCFFTRDRQGEQRSQAQMLEAGRSEPALPLPSCAPSSESLSLSQPRCSYLETETNNTPTHHMGPTM